MIDRSNVGRRSFLKNAALMPLVLSSCVRKRDSGEAGGDPGDIRLAGEPQVKRDFTTDNRSHKVIFIAHCIFNQNAREATCADFPAMMEPLLEALRKERIGIIQMACPELYVLGLGRDRTIPPVEIREGLESAAGRARLAGAIGDVIYQIKEYEYQGFQIVGILGKNGSPSCGVEKTWGGDRVVPGEGAFINQLRLAMAAEGLDIGIKGVTDHQQEEAIAWVKERV